MALATLCLILSESLLHANVTECSAVVRWNWNMLSFFLQLYDDCILYRIMFQIMYSKRLDLVSFAGVARTFRCLQD